MFGIYLHIPFCLRRCNYCDFCSSVGDENARARYVKALVKAVSASDVTGPADSVYFGGGTPSLLSSDEISEIITAVDNKFPLTRDCEITLEANPGTVSQKSLAGIRKAGVNRLSIGIQSASDDDLKRLGRLHDFKQAGEAFEMARAAGFDNISADIMLGLPYQTRESAAESVAKIADLEPDHVSAYMLKIEPGTAFDCPQIRDSVPPDDDVADIYLDTVSALESRGLKQYEISNFSKYGYESRHNLKYWTLEEYVGFGPSAHSFYGGRRLFTPPDIGKFMEDPTKFPEIEDASPNFLSEYVMLGLRLCKGISLDRFSELGGDKTALLKACKAFLLAGYMILDGDRLALTPKGFLVSNGIISEII